LPTFFEQKESSASMTACVDCNRAIKQYLSCHAPRKHEVGQYNFGFLPSSLCPLADCFIQ
jgi:hypothetical protein